MKIYIIAGLVLCGITLTIIVAAYIEHKRMQAKIRKLESEIVTLRKYTHYQQKQIDSLREHNGNLYDENLGLKCSALLKNIPDFSNTW